jgi:N-sulfoglucosamine sulfohydrolase
MRARFTALLLKSITTLCLAVVALVFVHDTGTASARDVERPNPNRPNIILITAEDLGPRFGFMDDPIAVTPNLDSLARESIKFTRAFTTSGVCAPSRSALITGVHQTKLGTMHMRTSTVWEGMKHSGPYEAVPPPEVKAFPEMLRASGYFTVNDAKTDYQFGDPFSAWDENRVGASWKYRADGQPFFAMINFDMTHEARTWTPGIDPALHKNVSTVLARNQLMDAEKTFRPTDPAAVRIPPYWPDTLAVRRNLARHYDNIRLMDQKVGKLLERLAAEGLLESSIIIFTTDHGDGLPRHKRTIFDSGTHVPLLVRFPDRRGAGTVRDDLVSFVDLAPTIMQMAGAKIPDYVDGRDVFSRPAPAAIFMAGDRFDEVAQRFRGVREQRWHYIRYFGNEAVIPPNAYQNAGPITQEIRKAQSAGELNELQLSYLTEPAPREFLFDTVADPFEVRNLANDARHMVVKKRLAGRLDRWLRQHRDLGLVPEKELVAKWWPEGKQPQTSAPAACVARNRKIYLSSATTGASIGWGEPNGTLQLYVSPVAANAPFAARSVRYGYRPSEPVMIDPGKLKPCRD